MSPIGDIPNDKVARELKKVVLGNREKGFKTAIQKAHEFELVRTKSRTRFNDRNGRPRIRIIRSWTDQTRLQCV